MPKINSVDLEISEGSDCLMLMLDNSALYLHGSYGEMIDFGAAIITGAARRKAEKAAEAAAVAPPSPVEAPAVVEPLTPEELDIEFAI